MPKYVYPTSMPYDEINIVDNSIYEDSVPGTIAGVPSGPIAFIPFISPKGIGEDNKLVYLTSDKLKYFGTPNLSKYGLSLYLANRFAQGGGTVLGMRVVPDFVDATSGSSPVAAHGKSYANACVFALVDATSKTVEYGVYNAKANDPLTNFLAATDADINGATVGEGKTLYKLFVIRAKAAGDFANSFYFNIIPDVTMNTLAEESGLAAYFYRFNDSNAGETLDGAMVFTFAEGFRYDGESMDPEDVFDTYSENVVFEKAIGAKGFDAFIEATGFGPDDNFLFPEAVTDGDDTTKTCGDFTITNDAIDQAVHLKGAVPLWLDKFDWDNDPFASDLAMAYGNKGVAPTVADARYNDLIYDEVRFPFQYMFAPTYDDDVVESMHKLVEDRNITHANFIAPYRATYAAQRTALGSLDEFTAVNSFKEVLVPEWCFIHDPYTGKKTRVPSVYMDAYGYPQHWLTLKGRPYAGQANYGWTEYVTGSVTPATSSPAEWIANHNARINSMVEDGFGNAIPYEQITRQTAMSALSEINNSYVLTDMIRIALAIAQQKRWTDLSDTAITEYKDTVYEGIASELGGTYDTVDVVTSRESINGAGRNRIRCSINVKFKDILKGVSYTFYIQAN